MRALRIVRVAGQAADMQLHHKNGDGLDNRLENLSTPLSRTATRRQTTGAAGMGIRKPERHLKLVPPVAESDEEEVG